MRPIALFVLLAMLPGISLGAQSSPADKRAAFLKLVEAPRVDPRPEVQRRTAPAPGLIEEHFAISVESSERVTGLLIKREDATGRRPVVIQLHGTNGNKEQLRPRLIALADRGIIGIAIDGRYHGERSGEGSTLGSPYGSAIFNAFKTGREHPFCYDTVLDVRRLIDYLETRPDVDPSRIGLGGFSKGGIETYLAAAVEPRIAAAVSGHGVQSFGWALDHGAWDSRAWTIRDALSAAAAESKSAVNPAFIKRFYDVVAPGIYGDFDGPAMLPLVAPRPLLVINGDSDPRTPMAGVRASAAAAEAAYKSAGAPEKFSLQILEGVGHEQTPAYDQAMLAWFQRWLAPDGNSRTAIGGGR
jgi:dienelactone hydrolase